MKLWEVIRALTQNSALQFKRMGMATTEIGLKNGELVWLYSNDTFLIDGWNLDSDEWEMVPRLVTWKEAIEAWANGKTIRLVMPQWEQILRPTNEVQLNACRIKEGKWYIEGNK